MTYLALVSYAYYVTVLAPSTLDNDRISAMFLMRPWEPTPMGE